MVEKEEANENPGVLKKIHLENFFENSNII